MTSVDCVYAERVYGERYWILCNVEKKQEKVPTYYCKNCSKRKEKAK